MLACWLGENGRRSGSIGRRAHHNGGAVGVGRLRITRKRNEGIVIRHGGEELRVDIMEIHPGQVALVFQAPRSFDIWRYEIDVKRREQLVVTEGETP
jgi:carbon storage regulator CsrA